MCNDAVQATKFIKKYDVDPADKKFTLDRKPEKFELDNPHGVEERIYDRFSKLSSCSQLKILKELEKSRQFQAMRHLIFHAVPDTSPDEFCSISSDLSGTTIAKRYSRNAFPITGIFFKWLNKVDTPDVLERVEKVLAIVPSHLKLGVDYEVFCFFNHFNELEKMNLVFQEKHFPDSKQYIAFYEEFRNKSNELKLADTGASFFIKWVIPTQLTGELKTIDLSFSRTTKATKVDLDLVKSLNKGLRESYTFDNGNDPNDIIMLSVEGGIVSGFAFSLKPKYGAPTEEGLEELKKLVSKSLERANQKVSPVKYFIKRSKVKPDYYTIHVKKSGPQEWDKYPLLNCPRRYRVGGDVESGLTFTESVYRSRTKIIKPGSK